jgi:hypothetical protein
MLAVCIFISTLKINAKNKIPKSLRSSPSASGRGQLPPDFDFWN